MLRRNDQVKALEYFLKTKISSLKQSPTLVSSSKDTPSTLNYEHEESEEILSTVVKDILKNDQNSPIILSINTDSTTIGEMKDSDPNTNVILELAFPVYDNEQKTVKAFDRIVRLPLISFCNLLSKTFHEQVTSTILCFVADASSGLGTELVGKIVSQCDAGMVSQFNLMDDDLDSFSINGYSILYILI